MVMVNAFRCPACGDTIYSRAHHDFRSCTCGAIHIDGGFDYVKIGWNEKKIRFHIPPRPFKIDVNATKEELYQDWNRREDKFGLIPASP